MSDLKAVDRKESLIIYYNWFEQLDKLGAQRAWRIVHSLWRFDEFDEKADTSEWDAADEVIYEILQEVLAANKEKYARRVNANKENGKKGGRPKKDKTAVEYDEYDEAEKERVGEGFPETTYREMSNEKLHYLVENQKAFEAYQKVFEEENKKIFGEAVIDKVNEIQKPKN